MCALSASELLEAWERSAVEPPVRRGLALLAAGSPGETTEQLARLSVGERDARLLRLRAAVFGPRLSGLANCPACGETVESDFTTESLAGAEERTRPESMALSAEGFEVRIRLPNTLDLEAAAHEPGPGGAKSRLLERCVVSAERSGQPVGATSLPPQVVHALSDAMEEADPQADIELALACPSCGHRWSAPFDIGSFFWAELNSWAGRTLREVHLLASAYGWTETEVLALSPWRRQAYLQMVGA
jgi:hypothetical protein